MPHYAVDAAQLLEQCFRELQDVIHTDTQAGGHHACLYVLKESLLQIEQMLYDHFQCLINNARSLNYLLQAGSISYYDSSKNNVDCDNKNGLLQSAISNLNSLLNETTDSKTGKESMSLQNDKPSPSLLIDQDATRSRIDRMLFQLIVALQLCLVRVDDARLAICGRRKRDVDTSCYSRHQRLPLALVTTTALLAAGTFYFHRTEKSTSDARKAVYSYSTISSTKALGSSVVLWFLRKRWNIGWMSRKIIDSTDFFLDWTEHWKLLQCTLKESASLSTDQCSSSFDQLYCNPSPDSSTQARPFHHVTKVRQH
jgi:hypothetical protein